MANKVKVMDKLYHGKDFEAKTFEYKKVWGLHKFTGIHPKVMNHWIKTHTNDIDVLNLNMRHELKNIKLAISDGIEKLTGWRIGEYKNYKLI